MLSLMTGVINLVLKEKLCGSCAGNPKPSEDPTPKLALKDELRSLLAMIKKDF